jgi:acyl carrier protein
MSTTKETIREALVDLGIPEDEVVPEAELRADLDVDSTELVEVVAEINAKVGTRLNSKALKGVRTVGDLTEVVERALAGTPANA